MIFILTGNDLKNKNDYIKKILKENESIFLTQTNVSKELLNNYAMNNPLFGESPVVVMENLLKEGDIIFNKKDLEILKESKTSFIFLEDKLFVSEEKKYQKYAIIEKFINKIIKKSLANNIFNIADAFARKDKIKTWVLYRNEIEREATPESIAGIIFWKIKTMILNGSQIFPLNKLKKQSSDIVSLHHRAHRGEVDFRVGLEQFILNSLS